MIILVIKKKKPEPPEWLQGLFMWAFKVVVYLFVTGFYIVPLAFAVFDAVTRLLSAVT